MSLVDIKKILDNINSPIDIKTLQQICINFNINGHLAILTQIYLNKIIFGEKTIESRFSRYKIAPYRKIKAGDIVFLKRCAGEILAIASVDRSDFFALSSSKDVIKIMELYYKELALEDTFKNQKITSKYATLIYLKEVLPTKNIRVTKSDRRPWVLLEKG
jgi:ASC-1-like (ASCH) protein